MSENVMGNVMDDRERRMTALANRRRLTEREREAFFEAVTMHDVLIKEGSGRGNAYRMGWNGHPWERSWISFPVYLAGKFNREEES